MKLDLSTEFDQNKARTRLETLIQRGAKIELKEFIPVRSLEHHRYAHKCIEIFFTKELGYTVDEGKQKAKMLFAQEYDWATYEVNGDRFFKSFAMTGDNDKIFNREETTIFIDWLRNLANEHGTYIPTPDEYFMHQWEIEK